MVRLWVKNRRIFGELKFANVGWGSKLSCGFVKLYSERPEEQCKQVNQFCTPGKKFSSFYGKEFWPEGEEPEGLSKLLDIFSRNFCENKLFFSRKFCVKLFWHWAKTHRSFDGTTLAVLLKLFYKCPEDQFDKKIWKTDNC